MNQPQSVLFTKYPYDGIARTDKPEYPVFVTIYNAMRDRFWIAETIDMASDAHNFAKLPPKMQQLFTENLAWQIKADSNQPDNLQPLIKECNNIELKRCLSNMVAEEDGHSASYQYSVSSMYSDPTTMLDSIDSMEAVKERAGATDLSGERTPHIICNMLAMEALSFTTSFLITMAINYNSNNALPSSLLQIKKIAADEAGHVVLFSNILRILDWQPHWLERAMTECIAREMAWVNYAYSVCPLPELKPARVYDLLLAKSSSVLRGVGIKAERVETPSLLQWYNQRIDINSTRTEQQAADSGAYVMDILIDDWQ